MIENPVVGMRVRYTGDGDGEIFAGMEGTLCELYSERQGGIDFGETVSGHDCSGNCTDGHGWRLPYNTLEEVIDAPEVLWVPAVGDRVLYAGEGPRGLNFENEPGVICEVNPDDEGRSGVRFDRDIGGHDCRGHCERPHGWYCENIDLRLEATGASPVTPTADLTLFRELTGCLKASGDTPIPSEIINGSYRDLAVYLCENDGEGVTPQEWQALIDAIEAIRARYRAVNTTSTPFVERLFGRSPVEF